MSSIGSFKSRVLSRELMVGTFLKTPHYVMIEIFAQSGFDFLCFPPPAPHQKHRVLTEIAPVFYLATLKNSFLTNGADFFPTFP